MTGCVADRHIEVLGHLMLVEHGANGDADPGGASQGAAFVVQPGGDGVEQALGCLQ
jgi:hypothetical protein